MIRKKVEAGKKPRLIFSDMEMPQHLDEREEESIHNAHEKSNSDVTILKVEMCPGTEKMK